MKTLRWFALLAAFTPAWIHGAEANRVAKIVAVSGNVSVTGGAAEVGAPVTIGSTVSTSSGGTASVQFFDGTITVVQPDSSVTISTHSVTTDASGAVIKENTLLDLHAGGVVNSLDPAKKEITSFKVRTPKGVAEAHGTVFAVRISQTTQDASVTTMAGTVTFVTDQGTFTVPFGSFSGGSGVQTVAEAVKSNPTLAAEILAATAQVASAIGNGSVGNTPGSPGLTTAVLAALVDVAIQAAPGQAADTLKTVLTNAGSALSSTAVEAVTQAAVNAVTTADPANAAANTASLVAVSAEVSSELGLATTTTTQPAQILPPLDQVQVSPSGPSTN
jgi:hypothetical protein